jgi:hypothetical protein
MQQSDQSGVSGEQPGDVAVYVFKLAYSGFRSDGETIPHIHRVSTRSLQR